MQYCISDGILKSNCTKTLDKHWEVGFTTVVIGRFFPVIVLINLFEVH